MPEDDQAAPERGLRVGDAARHLVVAKTDVAIRQRLTLVQMRLLVVGEEGNNRHELSLDNWRVGAFVSW